MVRCDLWKFPLSWDKQAWVEAGKAGTHVAAEGEAGRRVEGRGCGIYSEGTEEEAPKVTGVVAQEAGRMELLFVSVIRRRL